MPSKPEPGLFFIVGFFIGRNESSVCSCFVVVRFFHVVLSFVDHGYVCLLVPALRHLLLGLLLFRRSTSLPLRFAHSWPRLNHVRLERDCNTIAFPRSSSLPTVNARFCYFIGSPLFKLTHSSVKAWYVSKSLEGDNSHLFFERIPSL